jgi:hypothetical protein
MTGMYRGQSCDHDLRDNTRTREANLADTSATCSHGGHQMLSEGWQAPVRAENLVHVMRPGDIR